MVQGRWLALVLAAGAVVGYWFWPRNDPTREFGSAATERISVKDETGAEPATAETARHSPSADAESLKPDSRGSAQRSPLVAAMFDSPAPTAKEFFSAYKEELCQCAEADRECVTETVTRYATKMASVVWGDPATVEELVSEVKGCQERAWGRDYVPTAEERRMEFEAAEADREMEEAEVALKRADAEEEDTLAVRAEQAER